MSNLVQVAYRCSDWGQRSSSSIDSEPETVVPEPETVVPSRKRARSVSKSPIQPPSPKRPSVAANEITE